MKGTTSTTVTIIIHQNKVQYYAKWPTSIYHQPLHNNKNKDATIYREISLAGMDKPWMIIFHSEKKLLTFKDIFYLDHTFESTFKCF